MRTRSPNDMMRANVAVVTQQHGKASCRDRPCRPDAIFSPSLERGVTLAAQTMPILESSGPTLVVTDATSGGCSLTTSVGPEISRIGMVWRTSVTPRSEARREDGIRPARTVAAGGFSMCLRTTATLALIMSLAARGIASHEKLVRRITSSAQLTSYREAEAAARNVTRVITPSAFARRARDRRRAGQRVASLSKSRRVHHLGRTDSA